MQKSCSAYTPYSAYLIQENDTNWFFFQRNTKTVYRGLRSDDVSLYNTQPSHLISRLEVHDMGHYYRFTVQHGR